MEMTHHQNSAQILENSGAADTPYCGLPLTSLIAIAITWTIYHALI
jgi:hypothetical protein